MKIYDCFSYWDEDLLLDLRLNILNKYVDYFVIVEGNKTWQNNSKELRFDIKKFKNFKDKIIYIPVKDMPDGENPWLRENFQRNCIERGLTNSRPEDLIIISDVDEIPDLTNIKEYLKSKRYAVFKQKAFYYKINMQNKTLPHWYGSRVCKKKYLKFPQWLRNLKFKKRPFWRIDKIRQQIINGGWHFSFLQKPSDIALKIKSYSHGEFNKDEFIDEEKIKDKIANNKDIFGRDIKLKKIDIDADYPSFIRENKSKLKDWIL